MTERARSSPARREASAAPRPSCSSSEGAKVLINDLDGDVAEEAASEIDGETAVFAGDLTKSGTPEDMVKAAIDAFGQVDAVVNNAGYTWDGVVHKMTDEQFQAMLDIHTIVPFRVIRALAPTWREAAKRSPRRARRSSARSSTSPRSRARWAMPDRRTTHPPRPASPVSPRRVAKEWGQFKINCNAVAFGFVETRLTQAKEKGETMQAAGESTEEVSLGIPEQMRQMARMTIPLGRPAEPEDAAGPVAFLCSKYSNFVHGQVINVTGGQFTGMYS